MQQPWPDQEPLPSLVAVEAAVTAEGAPAAVEHAPYEAAETRRALDELFEVARRYRTTREYRQLLEFVRRFRFYSPFNAMLVHIQMPGARYVAPAYRWLHQWRRRLKPDARPLVILQPMGPVMFVFDVADTEPLEDAPKLPIDVEQPFAVRGPSVDGALHLTIENAKRDGVRVLPARGGSQWAGRIKAVERAGFVTRTVRRRGKPVTVRIPVRYEVTLNASHDARTRYASLVHELAHLYCGHLGTPEPSWWPDRSRLEQATKEFEAESVAYLVCARMDLESPSARYLSYYLDTHDEVPPISLDRVMAAAGLIEAMGRGQLPLRSPRRRRREAGETMHG